MPGWWRSRSAQNPPAEAAGQRFQAAVVQRGLPLPQVVHQQVADRPAGQVVTVDQLLRACAGRWCAAPAASAAPRRRRSPSGGASGRTPRSVARRLACALASASSSSRTSPDGDLRSRPPLAPTITAPRCRTCAPRPGETSGSRVAQRPQPGEPLRVPCAAMHARTRWPLAHAPWPRQPGQRRPDRRRRRSPSASAADSRPSRHADVLAAAAQPAARTPAASPGPRVGSAGQPPVLPAVTRLIFQPVQQHAQPARTAALRCRRCPAERRAGQPPPAPLRGLPGSPASPPPGARGNRARAAATPRHARPGSGRIRSGTRSRRPVPEQDVQDSGR